MGSFGSKYIKNSRFHPGTTWLVSQCTEARGMQQLWKKMRPETLKQLKEFAVVQSTESSNRIEGVEVERGRLLPLVLGKSKPVNRSEEEIVGYRKALTYIHKNFSKIKITPKVIKSLHKLCQDGMTGDAGKFKERDNSIIEILTNGERQVRFKCVSAEKTPKAIEQLCLAYEDVRANNSLPDIIAISYFVFDFLCIHPFRDGNGRVSRLLTLLLLYDCEYDVGRYISLERITEFSKDEYYKVLSESSKGWHRSEHDLMPWLNYFLGVVKNSYAELRDRVELSGGSDTKSMIIRESILTFNVPFSVSDIRNLHPSMNRELIKKVLFSLKKENQVKLSGKGRGAKWTVV